MKNFISKLTNLFNIKSESYDSGDNSGINSSPNAGGYSETSTGEGAKEVAPSALDEVQKVNSLENENLSTLYNIGDKLIIKNYPQVVEILEITKDFNDSIIYIVKNIKNNNKFIINPKIILYKAEPEKVSEISPATIPNDPNISDRTQLSTFETIDSGERLASDSIDFNTLFDKYYQEALKEAKNEKDPSIAYLLTYIVTHMEKELGKEVDDNQVLENLLTVKKAENIPDYSVDNTLLLDKQKRDIGIDAKVLPRNTIVSSTDLKSILNSLGHSILLRTSEHIENNLILHSVFLNRNKHINAKTFENTLYNFFKTQKSDKNISNFEFKTRGNRGLIQWLETVNIKKGSSVSKKSYIEKVKGHKNSDGELAEWCLTGDTKIILKNGKRIPISKLINKKEIEIIAFDIENKKSIITKATNIRLTQKNVKVVQVILSSGDSFKCTPDHLVLLNNGKYKKVSNLLFGDILKPVIHKEKTDSLQDNRIISVDSVSDLYNVYNLDVKKYHNFALGCGIFVHNCIKDHDTNKILKSLKTKEEAEIGLDNMRKFKNINANSTDSIDLEVEVNLNNEILLYKALVEYHIKNVSYGDLDGQPGVNYDTIVIDNISDLQVFNENTEEYKDIDFSTLSDKEQTFILDAFSERLQNILIG